MITALFLFLAEPLVRHWCDRPAPGHQVPRPAVREAMPSERAPARGRRTFRPPVKFYDR